MEYNISSKIKKNYESLTVQKEFKLIISLFFLDFTIEWVPPKNKWEGKFDFFIFFFDIYSAYRILFFFTYFDLRCQKTSALARRAETFSKATSYMEVAALKVLSRYLDYFW